MRQLCVFFALLCLGSSLQANVQTYGFYCVTANTATCGVDVAPQMFVDVISSSATALERTVGVGAVGVNADQVLFRFRNVGSNNSSITDVYFDDGTLLGIASLHGTSGVAFSTGAAPPNLPGGEAIDFNTTAGFLADSTSPNVAANGVNPGEALGVLFNLQSGTTYQDVIDAIALSSLTPTTDVTGGLRIGIHVQAIGLDEEESESLANLGPPSSDPVPEPSFVLSIAVIGSLLGWKFYTRRHEV